MEYVEQEAVRYRGRVGGRQAGRIAQPVVARRVFLAVDQDPDVILLRARAWLPAGGREHDELSLLVRPRERARAATLSRLGTDRRPPASRPSLRCLRPSGAQQRQGTSCPALATASTPPRPPQPSRPAPAVTPAARPGLRGAYGRGIPGSPHVCPLWSIPGELQCGGGTSGGPCSCPVLAHQPRPSSNPTDKLKLPDLVRETQVHTRPWQGRRSRDSSG